MYAHDKLLFINSVHHAFIAYGAVRKLGNIADDPGVQTSSVLSEIIAGCLGETIKSQVKQEGMSLTLLDTSVWVLTALCHRHTSYPGTYWKHFAKDTYILPWNVLKALCQRHTSYPWTFWKHSAKDTHPILERIESTLPKTHISYPGTRSSLDAWVRRFLPKA